jgi:hypothetical protein
MMALRRAAIAPRAITVTADTVEELLREAFAILRGEPHPT